VDLVSPLGSRGRLPFFWAAADHIQREDLRPGQGTEDREHSPGAGTARTQRSRNCSGAGRRQPGSGLPRDHLDRHSWLQLKKSLTCSQVLK